MSTYTRPTSSDQEAAYGERGTIGPMPGRRDASTGVQLGPERRTGGGVAGGPMPGYRHAGANDVAVGPMPGERRTANGGVVAGPMPGDRKADAARTSADHGTATGTGGSPRARDTTPSP